MKTLPLAVLIAAALAGCGAPAVPAQPTWFADVQPIVRANCIRCHGYPAKGGAPSDFRLDVYKSRMLYPYDGFSNVDGASRHAFEMANNVGGQGLPMPPPPSPHVSPRQRDIIVAWGNNLVDDNPLMGTRPGNHAPSVVATAPRGWAADATLVLDVVVDDTDGDEATGELRTGAVRGDGAFAGLDHAGATHVEWDTSALPPGTYTVTATVEDDLEAADYVLGTATISH